MDEKDVEKVVLRAVADRIGKDRFDVWFRDNQVEMTWREGRLEIAAPTRFYADRLAAMFGQEIEEAARRAAGAEPSLVFTVDPELGRPLRPVGSESPTRPAQPSDSSSPPPGAGEAPESSGREVKARRQRPFRTLETFVAGASNRMALTGVRATIEHPGDFSPLLLWGPPGTGKTHLLETIWVALRRDRRYHVLLVTAEQFTTMFLAALHGRGLPSFRQKFRSIDVLLIDDIQFFAQKKATLVELQHTVDVLHRAGKQLVLTADRSPTDLSGLGNELLTRITGGLSCGLQLPDLVTRRGLVARFLSEAAARLSRSESSGRLVANAHALDAVIEWIAQRVPGDARQLRGAVNQVVALARAQGRPLCRSLAQEALAPIAVSAHQNVGLEEIERAVCDVFGLQPRSLQSDKRSKVIAQPRMLAMWLARKYTPAVYAEIGNYFGRRSHSTVIAAQKKVRQWLESDSVVHLAGTDCPITEALQQVEARLRQTG